MDFGENRWHQNRWRKCISMCIVLVHGKGVYRKGLIVRNWRNIQWKFVIELSHKQIHIGKSDEKSEHLKNAICHCLIQGLFRIERFV